MSARLMKKSQANAAALLTGGGGHACTSSNEAFEEATICVFDLVSDTTKADMEMAGHGAVLQATVIPKARLGIDEPQGAFERVWPTLDDIEAIADLHERAGVLCMNPALVKDDRAAELFNSVRGAGWEGAIAYSSWVQRHIPPEPARPKPKRSPRPKKLPKIVSGPFVTTLLGDQAPAYIAALRVGPENKAAGANSGKTPKPKIIVVGSQKEGQS